METQMRREADFFSDMNEALREKVFLTVDDVKELLSCNETTIYNWYRRPDPERRPPRLMVGKSIRFPRKDFFRWLENELNIDSK